MKKIRKGLSIVLSLALSIAILAVLPGCGSGKQDELNVATGEMNKVAPAAAAEGTKESTATNTAAAPGVKKKIVIVEESNQDYVVAGTKAAVEEFDKLGYKDGQTAEITIIHLNDDQSKSADAVAKIKEINPDVVLVNNDRFSHITVAKPLLDSGIPVIVKQMLEDSSVGLVDSLEKPGHNVTGMITMGNLVLPSYQLLSKIAPINGKKACFMTVEGFPDFSEDKVKAALKSMNIELKEYKVIKNFEEMEETANKWNADNEVGWVLYGTGAFIKKDGSTVDSKILAKTLNESIKKPVVTYWEVAVAAFGFPVALAIDLVEDGRQMADIAKEIFDGKKPADIPVAEPRRTNIILNMAKIKELGLTIPSDILGGAQIYKDYSGTKAN